MKKKLQVRKTKAAIAMAAARLKRSSLEGNKSSGGSHRNIDFREGFEGDKDLGFWRFFEAEEDINQRVQYGRTLNSKSQLTRISLKKRESEI